MEIKDNGSIHEISILVEKFHFTGTTSEPKVDESRRAIIVYSTHFDFGISGRL